MTAQSPYSKEVHEQQSFCAVLLSLLFALKNVKLSQRNLICFVLMILLSEYSVEEEMFRTYSEVFN